MRMMVVFFFVFKKKMMVVLASDLVITHERVARFDWPGAILSPCSVFVFQEKEPNLNATTNVSLAANSANILAKFRIKLEASNLVMSSDALTTCTPCPPSSCSSL